MKYIVKEGDTLVDIANEHLGDPSKWKNIHSYNVKVIGSDPNKIEAGQKIVIPKDLSYIDCLKVEEAFYIRLAKSDEGFINVVYKVQDEIMASQFIRAIKWLIIIGVIYKVVV